MLGICVDCNREVEINERSQCLTCGSSSILVQPPNHPPFVDVELLLKEVAKIATLLSDTPPNTYNRAALQFISARIGHLMSLSLGQHLENTISMWNLVSELEGEKEKASAKDN